MSRIPGLKFVLCLAAVATLAFAWMMLTRPALHTGPEAGRSDRSWPDMRIEINHATPAQLCVLPQIGDALAERITGDRDAHGPFASLDDLARVHGIGERTLKRIAPFVVVE